MRAHSKVDPVEKPVEKAATPRSPECWETFKTVSIFVVPVSLRPASCARFLSCSLMLRIRSRPRAMRSAKISCLPRKEVIQPHLPIRLPCYDFTPVIDLTFGSWSLAVTSLTSGALNSHGVTGGVYKARERIHRDMLIRDY